MKPVKLAQIGMNRYIHGKEIFHTLTLHPEWFDLVGYTLVEDERETCADKLHWFEDYPELTLDEILNDPTIEAVAVETDEIHLTKYALLAAEHGKHIFMDKPGSQELADFERLIETVKKNGTVFYIGYMYRYNPLIAKAIERVRAGELGTIYSVEAHMSRLDRAITREWFGTFQGGMMFYLGCHLVDLVMQIQGEPSEVIPLNTRTGLDGVDTEDLGFAVMKYPNAVSMVRAGGTEVGGYRRRQLVICGSKGTLEIKPLEASIPEEERGKFWLYTESSEYRLGESPKTEHISEKSEPFQRYEAILEAFARTIRGEQENPHTADYELKLYKVILKCCGMEISKI